MTIERFDPSMPYEQVLERQRSLFNALIDTKKTPSGPSGLEAPAEYILYGEHPHVYTLGVHADEGNVLLPGDVPVVRIERGGDVTYHGHGQLVVYPILDLERRRLGIKQYVDAIEESVILSLADLGIQAGRRPGAPGVWIDSPLRKICALGVKCSRYVTMHGLALNVATDMSYFQRINPCGFTDSGVTSIALETSTPPSTTIDEVFKIWLSHFLPLINIRSPYKNPSIKWLKSSRLR